MSKAATKPRKSPPPKKVDKKTEKLIELLKVGYWAELETTMNYISSSINPDGVRAREVIESLETDILEELGHARTLGERIHELYGVVPGSMQFKPKQTYLQPPADSVDVVSVIKGVIQAERAAVKIYEEIIEFCDDFDLVTQDIAITILHDEQHHLRLFEGFLREYQSEGLA